MGDYIDELDETYEDPSGVPDKDEEMPSLQQETNGSKPIRKVLAVSELQVSQQRNLKVYLSGEKTRKQELDEAVFKSDRLRQKYDLRNKDPKEINDIFLRAHIAKLKERSK